MQCPKCGATLENLPDEKYHCPSCGRHFHTSYYCKTCGNRIDKHDYEEYDGLCFSCWDNAQMDEEEDFGIAPQY